MQLYMCLVSVLWHPVHFHWLFTGFRPCCIFLYVLPLHSWWLFVKIYLGCVCGHSSLCWHIPFLFVLPCTLCVYSHSWLLQNVFEHPVWIYLNVCLNQRQLPPVLQNYLYFHTPSIQKLKVRAYKQQWCEVEHIHI